MHNNYTWPYSLDSSGHHAQTAHTHAHTHAGRLSYKQMLPLGPADFMDPKRCQQPLNTPVHASFIFPLPLVDPSPSFHLPPPLLSHFLQPSAAALPAK